MPSNDSQAPDAIDSKQLVVGLSPKIPKAVRYACRFYGHDPNWDEVEDLSQDVIVKLIDAMTIVAACAPSPIFRQSRPGCIR